MIVDIEYVVGRSIVEEVGDYLVLFGDFLVGGAMVVKRYTANHDYDACSFCAYSTTGRMVDPARVNGKLQILAIDAVCATCRNMVERLDPNLSRDAMLAGLFKVLGPYRVVSLQVLHKKYQSRLEEREKKHRELIVEARRRLAGREAASETKPKVEPSESIDDFLARSGAALEQNSAPA